jgi:hypothetical protein
MQFLCISAKALTDKMKGFDGFLNIRPVRRFLTDLLQNAKPAPLFYRFFLSMGKLLIREVLSRLEDILDEGSQTTL